MIVRKDVANIWDSRGEVAAVMVELLWCEMVGVIQGQEDASALNCWGRPELNLTALSHAC